MALVLFHRAAPAYFLSWLSRSEGVFAERVRVAMALSGDQKRLPLLVDMASYGGPGLVREAAFRALAEMELQSFASRLHRMAGDPERRVRLGTATALVPSGKPWTVRLLFAEVDSRSPAERRLAREALERRARDSSIRILSNMVRDGTASVLAVDILWDLAEADGAALTDPMLQAMWAQLESEVSKQNPFALLAASRLPSPEPTRAVANYLQ